MAYRCSVYIWGTIYPPVGRPITQRLLIWVVSLSHRPNPPAILTGHRKFAQVKSS